MKKLRGLRLGRTLVRVCCRLLCRRRRPRRRAYVLLGAISASPPPRAVALSALYASSATQHNNGSENNHHNQATVTGKLWSLCRRAFASSTGWFQLHRSPDGAGGRAGLYDRGGAAVGATTTEAAAATASKTLPLDDYRRRRLPQHPKHACKPPKGHLVVYVGKGGPDGGPPPHRVLVPVIYFNHPLFGELLREAEQEYGFHHPGGITIPCPISDFESVRDRVAAAAASGGAAASDLHVRTASGRIWRWH